MHEKEGVVKYVNIVKRLFMAFSIVMIPFFLFCLFLAVRPYAAFWIITPAVAVLYFVVYGFYAMRVSMGTALGFQIVGSTVRVQTKRKTFIYDLSDGEIFVKESSRKYIVTFRADGAQDSFIFYRRVAFTPYHEEQFTKEDIRLIYSAAGGANA